MIKAIIFAILIATASVGCTKEDTTKYPSSSASYDKLNEDIGCDSKFVDEKKRDIFNASYFNHWMTWKGQVFTAEANEASLNLDGKGIQDLHVIFADSKGGYDVLKDQIITVKFVMKSAGGCILPFEGTQAIIILADKYNAN
jgi:hypothetical protein